MSCATPLMSLQVGAADPNDANLKRTVEEIKRLQEETSALRQENIQLKVGTIRAAIIVFLASVVFMSTTKGANLHYCKRNNFKPH